MVPLFLCVDCGGTKAAAVIADADANILGRGFGGPANYKDVERSVFLESVKTAVENSLSSINYSALPADLKRTLVQAAASSLSQSSIVRPEPFTSSTSMTHHFKERGSLGTTLLRRSSVPSPSQSQVNANFDPEILEHLHRISLPTREPLFAAIWAGCAGVDRPQDITDLTPLLSELFSIPSSPPPSSPIAANQSRSQRKPPSIPCLIIDNDTTLLATPLHHCAPLVTSAVVAIAGTGCIVVSFKLCHDDGGVKCLGRAGGWGWLLGDEGSGFYIGREALRRILEGADYGGATGANTSPRPGPSSAVGPSSAGLGNEPNGPAPISTFAMPPTDIETVADDEGLSPSSTSTLPSPISSARTMPPIVSSMTSTSSFPHPSLPTEPGAESPSPPSAHPPTLQERVFSHYGIAQPADIFTVVYTPDPPSPAPIGTAPGWMGPASSPPPSPTVVSAPTGGSLAAGDVPSRSDPTTAFKVTSSSTPPQLPSCRSSEVPKQESPSSPSAPSASPAALAGAGYANIERKARISVLTPIVFHSAFVDGDEVALDILESAAGAVARLIAQNLAPPPSPTTQARRRSGSKSAKESREPSNAEHPEASSSVLCLGGSLLGVPEYRSLVLKHLERMGHVFPYVEYVPDAAQAGVLRLVAMYGAGAATSGNHAGTTRENTSP